MPDKMVHLILTPQQAKTLAGVMALSKQFLSVAPNIAVYPNLGDFQLERELVRAEINATEEASMKQMEDRKDLFEHS